MHYKKVRLSRTKTMDEHRLIMEEKLGRKLLRTEEVHHKDGNKRNNHPDNLELLQKSDHARLHASGKNYSEATREKLRAAGIEKRSNARLSIDDVKCVKHLVALGLSNKEIIEKTGFDKHIVSKIRHGKSWGWVAI